MKVHWYVDDFPTWVYIPILDPLCKSQVFFESELEGSEISNLQAEICHIPQVRVIMRLIFWSLDPLRGSAGRSCGYGRLGLRKDVQKLYYTILEFSL